MADLQINVLGELTVVRQGRELVLPASKKTRALLAYLAVVARRQRREHLCRMLWDLPDDPRASLRWSLAKLRPILADGDVSCLVSDRDSVQLATDGVKLDLLHVVHLTAKDLPTLTTPELERLVRTFRGRFLEGLDLPRCPVFEAWRSFQADTLDRIRLLLLKELIERLRDDPGKVRPFVESLTSIDADGARQLLSELATDGPRPSVDLKNDGLGERRPSQVIRYCRSTDDVQIAYAISGKGTPILRAAHWMSHLQYEWESPVWRHWIDALSSQNTLIRYDERGNGLSDRDPPEVSFDAMVSDLESVAEAANLDRFALLGVSQSCAVSVAYAARNPERLSHLVLYGGYAKGWRKRGDPHEIEAHEAMTTLIREGWGKDNPAFRQMFTEAFIPGASREQMAWFNDLQRETAAPDNASRLHQAFGEMDVSRILARVRVPTLVLHARDDAAVPFEQGKALAAGIPGAGFVDLNSANHILLEGEPAFAEFVREVRAFLSTPGQAP